MIKNKAIIWGMILCVGLSSTTYALDASMADGKLTFSVTEGTCPGPDMTYTPSPSTVMESVTSATAYAITAASSKTDTDNGMEYGILSTNEGYFQRAQVTAHTVAAPTDENTLPGENWVDKNGSAPPAGS